MNFLAHLYLSRHDDGLMIGNFIADGIKGRSYQAFDPQIAKGILMHREIDSFTDTHEITSRSRSLLRADFRHYSGVILDVFYDHILARNWRRFSEEPLPEFTRRAYHLFHEHENILPERNKNILRFMEADNWLLSYADIKGIERTLNGMAKRVKFENKMNEAVSFLIRHEKNFETDFFEFFPLLIRHLSERGFG